MSTINILLKRSDGTTSALVVTFTPLSNPQVDGSAVLTKQPVRVTLAAAGTGTVDLEQGLYQVDTNDGTRFRIEVPNDSSTYSLSALVTSSTAWTATSYGSIRFTSILLYCADDGTYKEVKMRKDTGEYILEIQ